MLVTSFPLVIYWLKIKKNQFALSHDCQALSLKSEVLVFGELSFGTIATLI